MVPDAALSTASLYRTTQLKRLTDSCKSCTVQSAVQNTVQSYGIHTNSTAGTAQPSISVLQGKTVKRKQERNPWTAKKECLHIFVFRSRGGI